MPTSRALITGILGQDGSYLAELLLEKGYEVHGLIRRSSTPNSWRIDDIIERVHLHYGDLGDSESIERIIAKVSPDEVYNLGAQSHVRVSFDAPSYTLDTNAVGVLRLLEAIQRHAPKAKFYQACSSEMFGATPPPQREVSEFNPRSPYGVSKVAAYYLTRAYRARGLFAANGILFNHESPRRAEAFISQKVVQGFRKIRLGTLDTIRVGNVYAKRDWGYAGDYVRAIFHITHLPNPGDYVISTGESHTVKELIDEVAKRNGYELVWTGVGMDEKALDQNGVTRVTIDPRYYRPTEVEALQGDSTKAFKEFGWKPSVTFHELINLMVKEADTYAERTGST